MPLFWPDIQAIPKALHENVAFYCSLKVLYIRSESAKGPTNKTSSIFLPAATGLCCYVPDADFATNAG